MPHEVFGAVKTTVEDVHTSAELTDPALMGMCLFWVSNCFSTRAVSNYKMLWTHRPCCVASEQRVLITITLACLYRLRRLLWCLL